MNVCGRCQFLYFGDRGCPRCHFGFYPWKAVFDSRRVALWCWLKQTTVVYWHKWWHFWCGCPLPMEELDCFTRICPKCLHVWYRGDEYP